MIRCYIGPVRVPRWLYDLVPVRRNLQCVHRSHRLRLPCLREAVYDHWCGRHNSACWDGCPKEAR